MRGERKMALPNPSRAVFVRNLQSLVDIILTDHAYTKPWSAHPEASKAKPMKTLFLPKSEELSSPKDNIIDVCDVESVSNSSIVYDTTKAKTVMSECEKHVTTVTSKRTPDTWEELICRTGWGSKQNSLFDKVIKVLSTLRLARLAYEQTSNEPVKRRIATDKATKRFRQILSAIEWDPKLTAWLHTTLVDGLSIPLLACYLDVLQTLRAKAPALVDRIVANHTSQRRGPAANAEALSLLLKRPWDPSHGLVTQHKTRKLPGSPLLLIVPSGPTTNTGSGTSSKRTRFWHNQLSVLGKVVPVTMHTSNGGSGVTISQCLDHIIGAVRTKVLELRSHFPNRPIILIGWSIGALVSCQVALMETVCAVVCLGFPLAGTDGVRGDVEDPILELKTPVLFVIGSHSNLNSQEDIEEMRERLKAETSLLVVGGADEQLRLTRAKKKQEGLTQSMVDRLVMDQIGEFLGNVLTSPSTSMQQRNDLSDADESDIKKKKRKRSISRDLSAEMGGSGVKAKNNTQSPRRSQKMSLAEGGKSVLKIPVGGSLGALSNARSLSLPSPAKRQRTSKAKASKANAQTSATSGSRPNDSHGVPMQVGAAANRIGTPTSRALIQGIPIGASPSNPSTSLNPPTGQGFISLAAKGGGVLKPAASQSYLTMSGTPSIIKTASGSLQYIIKPQSQRHMSVPLSLSSTGSAGHLTTTAAQSGATSSAGIRYTSLSPSPTSPFTSILNLKGNVTPQGMTQGTPITGSAGARTVLSSSTSFPGVRATSTGVSSHQTDVLKRTSAGKPVGSQVFSSLPQHMTSTTSTSAHTNVTQITSAALSNFVRPTNTSQQRSSNVNASQPVVQMSSSTSAQVPTSMQITSARPFGSQSHVRYIVGSTSTSTQPVSTLQGTPHTVGSSVRTVTGVQQGRNQPTAMTARVSGQAPATQQVRSFAAGAPQLRANQSLSPSQQANVARIQNLSGKGAVTRTFVLTTASGPVVRTASPQTSLTSQGFKPGNTSVTHVLTSSPKPATGSGKPHENTAQNMAPTSVMLKGGTVVSMQSLLARLPHGTKVITSNSGDGSGNVYVVGNVLTQVQNTANRQKVEGIAHKAPASNLAVATPGNAGVKTAPPVRGTVISVSIPTTAQSARQVASQVPVQRPLSNQTASGGPSTTTSHATGQSSAAPSQQASQSGQAAVGRTVTQPAGIASTTSAKDGGTPITPAKDGGTPK